VRNSSDCTAKHIEARFTSSEIDGSKYRENRPSWWFKVSNLDAIAINIPPHFTQYFDVAYLVHDVLSRQVEAFIAITQPEMGLWKETKNKIEHAAYTRLILDSTYNLYFAVLGDRRIRMKARAPQATSPRACAAALRIAAMFDL
jgi:hypothetical protein